MKTTMQIIAALRGIDAYSHTCEHKEDKGVGCLEDKSVLGSSICNAAHFFFKYTEKCKGFDCWP